MEIPFQDLNALMPPNAVRIQYLSAEPLPDGRRIRVKIELTPFQQKPNLELQLFNPQGDLAAQATIIETMMPKMEITLHLANRPIQGEYTLQASVGYPEEPLQEESPALPRMKEVCHSQTAFSLSGVHPAPADEDAAPGHALSSTP